MPVCRGAVCRGAVSFALYFAGEDVAAATDGFDELAGFLVVVLTFTFEFAAESADGDVDGAVERASLAASEEVKQHIAGKHLVGAFDEGGEEVVFAAGEGDLGAVGVDEAAAAGFEAPAGEAVETGGFSGAGAALAGASQDGADAGEEFAGVEGFGQVVVGAEFEADDAVGFVAHGGEHDDGDVGHGAQPAGDVEAGLAGEHEVEDDELVVAGGPGTACVAAIADGGDAHSVTVEETGEEVADFAVIVDEQDVGGGVHRNDHSSVWRLER